MYFLMEVNAVDIYRNRKLTISNVMQKKQRGQKQKLKRLLKCINEFTPFTDTNNTYENFYVPCDRTFINHRKTSGKVKRIFCQKWLDKTAEFIRNKPENIGFCKIIADICPNDLWNSRIIIFYDDEYYNNFWNRNNDYQKWTRINGKSYAEKSKLKTDLFEQGYLEELNLDDFCLESELWFYGELKR